MTNKEADEKYIIAEEIEFLGAPVGDRFIEPETEISGYNNMKVELTAPTTNQAYKDWVSAALYNSLCTWDTTPHLPVTKMDKLSLEEKANKLFYILKKRPISVALEGVSFNFRITNIPRSLTHQLVRHRAMAFGQQSYRVSSCYSDPVRAPQSLFEKAQAGDKKAEGLLADYVFAVRQSRDVYKKLIEAGVPMEQARNIMPMGTCTKIGVTMRLRDLIDYVKGRTGDIAMDEHSYMVSLMLQEVKTKQPDFFNVVKLFAPKAIEVMDKYLVNKDGN